MQRADDAVSIHRTAIELSTAIPSEVEAGASISLTVRVYCPEGCDLRDAPVALMAGDRVMAAGERASQDGESPVSFAKTTLRRCSGLSRLFRELVA
jgi:hypothetical protein